MTSLDQLRIDVATELGWKQDGSVVTFPDGGQFHGGTIGRLCPKFEKSLDACHEGWEKDAPYKYWEELFQEVNKERLTWLTANDRWLGVCNATPEQRCRAFLKWSAEKKGK